jgi:hypothetical protein
VPASDGSTRAFSILVNGARGEAVGVDAAIDAFAARLGEPSGSAAALASP